MKILSFAVAISLLGIAGVGRAAECDCPARPSPMEALQASTVVLEAYVVAVGSTSADSTAYRVSVNKVWKGEPTKNAIVHTRGAGTACAVSFAVGKNYLIYAKGNNMDIDVCSRTFDDASHAARLDYQEDLAAFKAAGK
jgi:hypothetical protein